MTDRKWYVVAPAYARGSGELYVSQYDTVATGRDPHEVIARDQTRFERRMVAEHGCDVRDQRPGKLFAVWGFPAVMRLADARDAIRRVPPWRMFVVTDGCSWRSMAQLVLPEGADLFSRERDSPS